MSHDTPEHLSRVIRKEAHTPLTASGLLRQTFCRRYLAFLGFHRLTRCPTTVFAALRLADSLPDNPPTTRHTPFLIYA